MGPSPRTLRNLEKPKLTPRQATLAEAMYDQFGPDGKRADTVQLIADEFGVTRPTIYRHLQPRLPCAVRQ